MRRDEKCSRKTSVNRNSNGITKVNPRDLGNEEKTLKPASLLYLLHCPEQWRQDWTASKGEVGEFPWHPAVEQRFCRVMLHRPQKGCKGLRSPQAIQEVPCWARSSCLRQCGLIRGQWINLPPNKVARTQFLRLHSCAFGITRSVFFKIEIAAKWQNLYLLPLHSGLASQVSSSVLTPRSALRRALCLV